MNCCTKKTFEVNSGVLEDSEAFYRAIDKTEPIGEADNSTIYELKGVTLRLVLPKGASKKKLDLATVGWIKGLY